MTVKAFAICRCAICGRIWDEYKMCRDQDDAADWREWTEERHDLCLACEKIVTGALEDHTVDENMNSRFDLYWPPLEGPALLIEPAIKIRRDKIDELTMNFTRAVPNMDEFRFWVLDHYKSAAWWIQRRHLDRAFLFGDLWPEFKASRG